MLSVFAACGTSEDAKGDSVITTEESVSANKENISISIDRKDLAAYTENFSVSKAMMCYYFNSNYNYYPLLL